MISCIIALMDREENLEKMLPSWTKVEEIKDFVIVDWSSKEPVIKNPVIQAQMEKHKNIKVIRVENQSYYYRCLALNLANSYTEKNNKILLKLDADYTNIDSSWLKFQSINNEELVNYFICGNGIFNIASVGFLFVNKRNFNEVNGYNENLRPMWGYEDEDIQARLSKLKGLRYSFFWEHQQKNPEFIKITEFDIKPTTVQVYEVMVPNGGTSGCFITMSNNPGSLNDPCEYVTLDGATITLKESCEVCLSGIQINCAESGTKPLISIVDRIGKEYEQNEYVYAYYDTYTSKYIILDGVSSAYEILGTITRFDYGDPGDAPSYAWLRVEKVTRGSNKDLIGKTIKVTNDLGYDLLSGCTAKGVATKFIT
jgi:hypothetical protein